MPSHWTDEDLKSCELANSFEELLAIALHMLNRINKHGEPIVEICGPMTTGGTGSATENFRLYNNAVKALEETGKIVFNPTPFQYAINRLCKHIGSTEYNMDILEVFYKGIFSSGFIHTVYFLPNWQSSKGASWERLKMAEFDINIEEYPSDLLSIHR